MRVFWRSLRYTALLGLAVLSVPAANAATWAPMASISATAALVTNSLCYTDGKDLVCNGAGPALGAGASTFASLTDVSVSIAGGTIYGPGSLSGAVSGYGANTALGVGAMNSSLLTSTGNSAFGRNALANIRGGAVNTGIGSNALNSITNGSNNTAIGGDALFTTATGDYNSAVGRYALYNNTSAYNTGIGAYAMRYKAGGTYNTAIGYSAGLGVDTVTTGTGGTYIGAFSGAGITTGLSNTLIGYNAGAGITTGSSNLVIGAQTTPYSNTGSNQLNIANAIWGNFGSGTGNANKIGINTTSPTSNFDVSGTSHFSQVVNLDSQLFFNDIATSTGTTLSMDGNGGMLLQINTAPLPNLYLEENGRVGVGTVGNADLFTALQVSGTIRLGNSGEACDTNRAGAIRYTSSSVFQTCNGTTGWQTLGSGSGGGTSSTFATLTDVSYSTAASNIYGPGSLTGATSGTTNVTAFGIGALSNASNSGSFNTAFGSLALNHNTTGAINSAFGYNALLNNSTGNDNVAVGQSALYSNTSGSDNIAIGLNTGLQNTTGYNNIAIGTSALYGNATGFNNTAVGAGSMSSNRGYSNTAYGANSLKNQVGGVENVAVGADAMYSVATGTGNVAMGSSALNAVTAVTNTTAIGYRSGLGSSSSYQNGTYLGAFTGYAVTTGGSNTLIGYNAGSGITTGANNLVIGASTSPLSNTGSNQLNIANAILGNYTNPLAAKIGINVTSPTANLEVSGTISATALTVGGVPFTGGGTPDRIVSTSTKIIASSTDTALYFITNNTQQMMIDSNGAVGINTSSVGGQGLTVSGTSAISGRLALSTATGNNVMVGSYSGLTATGSETTLLGFAAGQTNSGGNVTAIGNYAARNNTGQNVTALGYGSVNGTSGTNPFSNVTGVGYNAQPTMSNQVMLGDINIAQVYSYGAGIFGKYIKPGGFSTASLPSATTAGAGAIAYDTDVSSLKFSNGSTWSALGGGSANVATGVSGSLVYRNATGGLIASPSLVMDDTGSNIGFGTTPPGGLPYSISIDADYYGYRFLGDSVWLGNDAGVNWSSNTYIHASGIDNYMAFGLYSNDVMTIASNTYVGIGTSNPNANLEVSGTISATSLRINGVAITGSGGGSTDRITSSTSGVYVSATGVVSIGISGTTASYFNAAGIVTSGISTTGTVSVTSLTVAGKGLTLNTLGDVSASTTAGTLIAVPGGTKTSFKGNSITSFGVGAAEGGSNATAMGNKALWNNAAADNTAMGYTALLSNSSGYGNTAIGSASMGNNETGIHNTAVGGGSLGGTYTVGGGGDDNAAFGSSAGYALRSGSRNTYLGSNSGLAGTTGSSNTLVGYNAGGTLTTGSNNIFLGAATTAVAATGSNQLNIGNAIWGTVASAAGANNKIGINVTSPTANFEVSGTISATTLTVGGVAITGGGGSTDRITSSTTAAVIANTAGGTVSFTLGSTAGAAYLHPTLGFVGPGVSTTGPISGTMAYFNPGNGYYQRLYQSGANSQLELKTLNSYAVTMGVNEGSQLVFSNGNAPRMAIDSSGNVGINTGLAGISSTLQVVGTSSFSSNVGIGTTTPGSYMLYVAGNAYSTGSWSTSDARYKENIQPMTGLLAKVGQLRPVTFTWKKNAFPAKDNPGEQIGLIAQEVEKVYPELVHTNSDGYKAVAYDKLGVLLLGAVKDLKAQNESLSAQNIELRATIKAQNQLFEARLRKLEAASGQK